MLNITSPSYKKNKKNVNEISTFPQKILIREYYNINIKSNTYIFKFLNKLANLLYHLSNEDDIHLV